MLTGTGPNLIVVNQADAKYKESITFVKWATFATPTCLIMTIIAWGVLVFVFLMDKDRNKINSEAQNQRATEVINQEYNTLGKVTFPEYMIIGNTY